MATNGNPGELDQEQAIISDLAFCVNRGEKNISPWKHGKFVFFLGGGGVNGILEPWNSNNVTWNKYFYDFFQEKLWQMLATLW